MKNSWGDYIVAIVACLIFPILIPVVLGFIAFGMVGAARKDKNLEGPKDYEA